MLVLDAEQSTDIPSTLKHILTLLSPEISLAVLPRHLSPKLDRDDVPSASKQHVGPSDACLDVYDDLGMELVDEEETAHDQEVEGKDGDEESLLGTSVHNYHFSIDDGPLTVCLTLYRPQPSRTNIRNPPNASLARSHAQESSATEIKRHNSRKITF